MCGILQVKTARERRMNAFLKQAVFNHVLLDFARRLPAGFD
jgi:hypothetical protein